MPYQVWLDRKRYVDHRLNLKSSGDGEWEDGDG